MFRIASWVLLGALLTGCGHSITFAPTNAPPRAMAARSAKSVEVYTAGPPSEEYVEVGVLEIEQDNGFSSPGTNTMIRKLREKGAALGCEAIVVNGSGDRAHLFAGHAFSAGPAMVVGANSSLRSYRATCLVFARGPVEP